MGGTVVQFGTLSVTAGGKLQTGQLFVEYQLEINGPGSVVSATDGTVIGFFGDGSLMIGNGGVLNSGLGAVIVSLFGAPEATVTGAGSTWNIDGLPAGRWPGAGSAGPAT